MAIEARFSFLTAGPRFRLSLPDDFDVLPDLSSPLTIKNGAGPRSFDFVASSRDDGVQEEHRFLGTLTGRDGHAVELYERLEAPRQWYLRWLLPTGVIYTHLRDEDGVERAETIAGSLGITVNGGAPFLLPERPLGRGVSNRPGYQELAVFRSPSRADWAITLRRPSFLARGKVVQSPEGRKAILRGGAGHDTELAVYAGEDVAAGRETIRAALASFDVA
jgi:hypothetical protein